jgi:hypothetical protein
MTTILVQATLPRSNNIPADSVMNTWHFISDGLDRVDDALLACLALADFYNAIEAIFGAVMTGDVSYKCYDLEDPQPRSPFQLADSVFTPQGGISLPGECAICLSYNGTPVSGIPAGRRRGRIFLGCLDADVVEATDGETRLTSGVTSLVADAANDLRLAAVGTDWNWAVFSPTIAGSPPWSTGEIIAASLNVEFGHVDNAVDTIRSRGAAATARTTWG